MVQSSVS